MLVFLWRYICRICWIGDGMIDGKKSGSPVDVEIGGDIILMVCCVSCINRVVWDGPCFKRTKKYPPGIHPTESG